MSIEQKEPLDTLMFEGLIQDLSARPKMFRSKEMIYTLTIQVDAKGGPALFEAIHRRNIRGVVHFAVNVAI